MDGRGGSGVGRGSRSPSLPGLGMDAITGPSGAALSSGRRRPTMIDVARAAGVGLTTVSRVVNRDAAVRPATAARVFAAIEELGYRRNDLARSLRPAQASSTVGLIIGDIGNPFFAEIARGAEDVARHHGFLVIAGSSGEDPERERELVAALVAKRVEGLLLVAAGTDHAYLAREIAGGLPVVFVDRPPRGLVADAVVLDNRQSARRGVRQLLDADHRRIVLLADDADIHTAAERISGYFDAHADLRLDVDPSLVHRHCGDVEAARRVVTAALAGDDPPTAIFAINNRMSLGAVFAVHERGDRVAVLGFDRLEYASLLPPISVIAHDPRLMGRQAAELLFRRLDGATDPWATVVIETDLIAYE